MRRRRRTIPQLADLDHYDFARLVEFGRMTWAEVRNVIRDRMLERVGHDPYAHLREGADE